jgi:hypothetical protein
MRVVQRVLLTMFLATALGGCGDKTLKAAGDECFASSECATGLTCDFGQDPPVCAGQQTTDPDGAPEPDARVTDAAPLPDGALPIDAPPEPIDAPPEPIDAPPEPIDAAPDAPP